MMMIGRKYNKSITRSILYGCQNLFSSVSLGLIPEIMSKDMIKPSFPTPNNLKKLQLSFLDQIQPPLYMPFIFFYEKPAGHSSDNTTAKTSVLLKQSLSETLTNFYPLAGKIQGNISIDCNDQGVEYREANVSASLSQVIKDPNLDQLTKLLPFEPVSKNKSVIAGVQVNHFSCGSLAVSICIFHKIADGTTFSDFVNTWAAKACTNSTTDQQNQAEFGSASLYPPKNCDWLNDWEGGICNEKIVNQRLLFDKVKLDMLRKQCSSSSSSDASLVIKPPTRVEAVSSFIWKCFIEASRAKENPPKTFGVLQMVNFRSLASSPVSNNFYGNHFWFTPAIATVEKEVQYPELIGKMRGAVKQIDGNYVNKVKTGESCILNSFNGVAEDNLAISSCTKFPFYEANFGWGKPIWVHQPTIPYKNSVLLMSTKCGQGIEAWVRMVEPDVSMLLKHADFLSVTSPSIISTI